MRMHVRRVRVLDGALRDVAAAPGVRREVERIASGVAADAQAELPRVRGQFARQVAYRAGVLEDERGAVGFAGSDSPLSWLAEHGTSRMPAYAPLRNAVERI